VIPETIRTNRGNDIERVLPVGKKIAVPGCGHRCDDEINRIEPAAWEDGLKMPNAGREDRQIYGKRSCGEGGENRIVPAQLPPHPAP
jgi:hypothetical protein